MIANLENRYVTFSVNIYIVTFVWYILIRSGLFFYDLLPDSASHENLCDSRIKPTIICMYYTHKPFS